MSKQTEDFPEKKQWAGYDQGTDAKDTILFSNPVRDMQPDREEEICWLQKGKYYELYMRQYAGYAT